MSACLMPRLLCFTPHTSGHRARAHSLTLSLLELMSRTGILIAPHGAALANAMFLPQHAVVIEARIMR